MMEALKLTGQIDYFGTVKYQAPLLLPIFGLLFFGGCAKAPERNCELYRTGTFNFTQEINGVAKTTHFTRTEELQIERYESNIDSATVRWINDCEYILTNLNPKNKQEERPIHIKILTTTDSSYTFEFNIVGEPKKLRGTAIKNN